MTKREFEEFLADKRISYVKFVNYENPKYSYIYSGFLFFVSSKKRKQSKLYNCFINSETGNAEIVSCYFEKVDDFEGLVEYLEKQRMIDFKFVSASSEVIDREKLSWFLFGFDDVIIKER